MLEPGSLVSFNSEDKIIVTNCIGFQGLENTKERCWMDFIQSLDKASAEFYKEVDDQLQAIQNLFIKPFFLNTKILGAIGVFGSAVLSDSVRFVYPRKTP